VEEKAEFILKFQTDSKFILKFLHISSKFLQVLSKTYHSEIYIENIFQGALLFFLHEDDLVNFIQMGEKVASKINRQDVEALTTESHRVRVEVVKYPPNVNLKMYEQMSVAVAEKVCKIVEFRANYDSTYPRFDVKFKRGRFFDTFLAVHHTPF
jgi:hypothetical protein